MDGDFQQQYISAEKAYGQGDFELARSISAMLLEQLEPIPETGPERDAVLAWRSFIALLMGHIQLYGLNNQQQALAYYQLVLESQPDETLRELAEQGLERSQSNLRKEAESSLETPQEREVSQQPSIAPKEPTQPELQPTAIERPELIRDPFLKADSGTNEKKTEPWQSQTTEQSGQQGLQPAATLHSEQPELIRDPFLPKEGSTATAPENKTETEAPDQATAITFPTVSEADKTALSSAQRPLAEVEQEASPPDTAQQDVGQQDAGQESVDLAEPVEPLQKTQAAGEPKAETEAEFASNSAKKQEKQQNRINPESAPDRVSEIEPEREPKTTVKREATSKASAEAAATDPLKESLLRIMMPSLNELPKQNQDERNQEEKIIENKIRSVNKSPEILKKNPPINSKLEVIRALREGWDGFRRAPWTFVLFTLLLGALNLIFQTLSNFISLDDNTINISTIIILLFAVIGNAIVNLWGITGLIRGSWMAVNGKGPSFANLIRWDSRSCRRLFIRQLVLGLLFFLIIMIGGFVAGGLAAFNQILAFIPMIICLIIGLTLSINQVFLPWISLAENLGPLDTIQRGWNVVNPAWGMVMILGVMEFLIILLGTLLCFVGLLAAAPVVICISTAAYRQLFGSEDQTGLLSAN